MPIGSTDVILREKDFATIGRTHWFKFDNFFEAAHFLRYTTDFGEDDRHLEEVFFCFNTWCLILLYFSLNHWVYSMVPKLLPQMVILSRVCVVF